MRILVFDNYDSFTWNLVHLIQSITEAPVDVFKNDEIPLREIYKYDKILLSPGPGLPADAGLLLPLVKEFAPGKSILGVCLGHQAIGEAFGGQLVNLDNVYHGVAMEVHLEFPQEKKSSDLFQGLPEHFPAGRYHSWVISEEKFPAELRITARDEMGHIMALQHTCFDVQGVQFHPESILTPAGEQIIRNWLGEK
jgi:anthranilate synthase component 2